MQGVFSMVQTAAEAMCLVHDLLNQLIIKLHKSIICIFAVCKGM